MSESNIQLFATWAIPVDINYFLKFIDGFCHMQKILSNVCKSWKVYFNQEIIDKKYLHSKYVYTFRCPHGYNLASQIAYEQYTHGSNVQVLDDFVPLVPIWKILNKCDKDSFLLSKSIWANYDIYHLNYLSRALIEADDNELINTFISDTEESSDKTNIMDVGIRNQILLLNTMNYLANDDGRIELLMDKLFPQIDTDEKKYDCFSHILDSSFSIIQEFAKSKYSHTLFSVNDVLFIEKLLSKFLDDKDRRDKLLGIFSNRSNFLIGWYNILLRTEKETDRTIEYVYIFGYYGRKQYEAAFKCLIVESYFEIIRKLASYNLFVLDDDINIAKSQVDEIKNDPSKLDKILNLIIDFPCIADALSRIFNITDEILKEQFDKNEIMIKINTRRMIYLTKYKRYKIMRLLGIKVRGRYGTPINKIITIMDKEGLKLKPTDIKFIYDSYN